MAEAGSNIDWKNIAIFGCIAALVVGVAGGAALLGRPYVNWQDKRAAKKKQVKQTASSK